MISIYDGDINSDDGCSNDYDWGGNQNGRGDVVVDDDDDEEDEDVNNEHGVNDRDCVNHDAADGDDDVIGIGENNISGDDGGNNVNISVGSGDGEHDCDADVDDGSGGNAYNVNGGCGDMMMVMTVELAVILVMMIKLGDCSPDVYCGDNDDGADSVGDSSGSASD